MFSWVKKLLDPLNHAGWKSLFLDKVENLGGDKFLDVFKTRFK
jgi:hypothetical protein